MAHHWITLVNFNIHPEKLHSSEFIDSTLHLTSHSPPLSPLTRPGTNQQGPGVFRHSLLSAAKSAIYLSKISSSTCKLLNQESKTHQLLIYPHLWWPYLLLFFFFCTSLTVICCGFFLLTSVLIVNHFGQRRLRNAVNVIFAVWWLWTLFVSGCCLSSTGQWRWILGEYCAECR